MWWGKIKAAPMERFKCLATNRISRLQRAAKGTARTTAFAGRNPNFKSNSSNSKLQAPNSKPQTPTPNLVVSALSATGWAESWVHLPLRFCRSHPGHPRARTTLPTERMINSNGSLFIIEAIKIRSLLTFNCLTNICTVNELGSSFWVKIK